MLSLIILAYNDGNSLKEMIPQWITILDKSSLPYELIVSDDGSLDDTPSVMNSFMQHNEHIRYVRTEQNNGVGANFRMGVSAASGDLIAYTDGDGQYLPEDLLQLLHEIRDCHMITGKRVKRADPWVRHLTSRIYNRLVRVIYPVTVTDINSGLKLFTRQYLDLCNPQFSNGPFFDAEYLIKGYKKGLSIRETGIGHQERKHGKAAGISFRSLRLLFSDLCRQPMKPFTRKNYLSRFLFRLLAS